jgi:hypothetical protein
MQSISTIGLGIAKSVFQVHGVDAAGQVVLRRQLKRRWRSFERPASCFKSGLSPQSLLRVPEYVAAHCQSAA